jgi:lipid-binding SYLF domain-containing protein
VERKRVAVRLAAIATVGALTVAVIGAQGKEEDRLRACATVLKEILDIPDDIPKDLLDKAECVIVVPSVKKVAMGVGASYGRGAMTCRAGDAYDGPWSAPALFAIEGGSFGAQLGGQATDYVLLIMNDRGARSVLGSQVKVGADASAAAGPKGRTAGASTDIVMNAEILTYSRGACSRASRWRARRCVRMAMRTRRSTVARSPHATSSREESTCPPRRSRWSIC